MRSSSSLHTSFESNMSVSFDSDVDHLLADSQVVSSYGHLIPIVIGHRLVKPTIRVRSQYACITRVKIPPFTMPNIPNANIRGGICGTVDELAVVFVVLMSLSGALLKHGFGHLFSTY